ncbi:MAG: ATP-binding protein [Planctomycetes bacterium]|nr:ATP-binding protein [Planctomycetota bacterium]
MSTDLVPELTRSLRSTLEKADRLQKGGDPLGAAGAYEAASRLMFRLAESAPVREQEVEKKRRALRYREYARRLRGGGEPALEREGNGAGGREGAADGHAAEASGGRSEELRGAVSQMIHASTVEWDRIGGLEATKDEIKFALGLTLARPPEGVRLVPWRNILFYGPPGTGKTLLAAATSNALRLSEADRAVFFNVKVSGVMSKYFGESSRLVSELYGMARDASPSVVFLDEFESLCPTREEEQSGAERRILSTILAELDGLAEKGRDDVYVLTIAATNRPWDIDGAVLSRFEKKVLIPLPDDAARGAILRIHLEGQGYRAEVPLAELVDRTRGCSGRELERFCKEAVSHMVADLNRDLPQVVDRGLDAVRGYRIRVRSLVRPDFDAAAARLRPQTSPEEMRRFLEWKEDTER